MNTLHIIGYEMLEILYEDSSTFICRAQNREGKNFLLKVMKDDQPTTEQLDQFEYEYTLLKSLDISGILRVIELVKDYKGYVMVMEDTGVIPLMDFITFKSNRQGARKLNTDRIRQVLEIFIEMTKLIGRIHDINRIHKEISTENFLFVPGTNKVNLVDLGAVGRSEYSESDTQKSKTIKNMLPYISPEQTGRLGKTIDYRTDFYSLGVSMYELITGKKPFECSDPMKLVHSHIAVMPIAPRLINSDIPEQVSVIIMKLLEKSPEQRYQSAEGIVMDFEKCLERLRTSGVVERFELGKNDVTSKFIIPKKLYGRNNELRNLKQIYDQASKGSARMLLVSGYAGVGKTTIIEEIYRPIAELGGIFVRGKAEQLQKNTPYYVFIQVAKELIGIILQERDLQLEQWKERLIKALNSNGLLITDIVPELEAIIGVQPILSELGPAENRNRLLYTFSNFFKIFAEENNPLTVFLDDLQWCDQPSMEMIKYMLSIDEIENLLVIGCFRDNELTEGHPLHLLLEELQNAGKTVTMSIKPLEEEHIAELLADTLHQKIDKVRLLAGTVYKKTQGNPFFVRKLLFYLNSEHYIYFNGSIRQWKWDQKEIERKVISDNIVDFMIQQIMKLPPETQDMLKLAALIGNTFDLKLLSDVACIPIRQTVANLSKAVEAEIILPNGNYYIIEELMQAEQQSMKFCFAHDRVQQACAAIMAEEKQKQVQLKIGRIIKANINKNHWTEHAMEIVSHLNEALDMIYDVEERWETARLNLLACRKAIASSAFHPAFQYISDGVGVLPENAWIQDYGFTLEMTKSYVECAYLNNEYKLG